VSESLSDVELEMLAFERLRWQQPGAREQAIRDMFGLSLTRYLQALNTLIEKPAAVAVDPVTVNRLRRLKATRAAARDRQRQRPQAS
jgi:Protein of unknown function (DUF3263)